MKSNRLLPRIISALLTPVINAGRVTSKTIKSAGFLCLIGIGLGLGFTSWLLSKLYRPWLKRIKPPDTNSTTKELQDKTSPSTAKKLKRRLRKRIVMGQNQSSKSHEAVRYSDLTKKEYSQYETNRVIPSSLSATIESSRGVLVSQDLPQASCCSTSTKPSGRKLENTETPTNKLSDEDACDNEVSGVFESGRITPPIMKDSGFLENNDHELSATELSIKPSLEGCVTGPHSTCNDSFLQDCSLRLSLGSDSNLELSDEQTKPTSDDADLCEKEANSKLSPVGQLRQHKFHQHQKAVSETLPPLSPAEERRRAFSSTHYRSLMTPLPLKDRSRSSSVFSSMASLDIDSFLEPEFEFSAIDTFLKIDNELKLLNKEVCEMEETFERLNLADTGEWHSSPKTTYKLSDIVSQVSPVVADMYVSKAFDVLRKYRRNRSKGNRQPRMASLPPPQRRERSASSSRTPDRITTCNLPTSHSCAEISQYDNLGEGGDDSISGYTDSTVEDSVTMSLDTVSKRLSPVVSLDSITSDDELTASNTGGGSTVANTRIFINEYATAEWQGKTEKASAIRKGYQTIVNEYRFTHLIRIRGDNYCAVRAVLCSMVLNDQKPTSPTVVSSELLQKLSSLKIAQPEIIHSWNFAQRLPHVNDDEKFTVLTLCLEIFFDKLSSMYCLESRSLKEMKLFQFLNSASIDEIYCLEALKLLMLLEAVDLYNSCTRSGNTDDNDDASNNIPLFSYLIFARDSSTNPYEFVVNHLNKVGDSAGLDQLEMCLLGHSLGLSLLVFRPYLHNKEEFCVRFPDSNESHPNVPLVSEDDRHYNVVVTS